jgi:hypothetical protein
MLESLASKEWDVTHAGVGSQKREERKGKKMRRRVIMIGALVLLILTLSAGVALARQVLCTGGLCLGTNNNDTMFGSLTDDTIIAKKGRDIVNAANLVLVDSDAVSGGGKSDAIDVLDGDTLDIVSCGKGIDTVLADDNLVTFDLIGNDCEFWFSSVAALESELENPQKMTEEQAEVVRADWEEMNSGEQAKQAKAKMEEQAKQQQVGEQEEKDKEKVEQLRAGSAG